MFIDRFKELQFEMTQREMDEKCNLPPGTTAQYLGGRQPTIANALKIANAFNVTLDWLLK